MRAFRPILIWGVGGILSFLFIWGVGSVFHDSVVPMVQDHTLKRFIRLPGATIRQRSEGWADTEVAVLGLTAAGASIIKTEYPRLVVWGDSHGEARQVGARSRLSNVFNEFSGLLKAVTVADGGMSVADYYYLMQDYEKLIGNVQAHVVLLSGISDVVPGEHLDCRSRFLDSPLRLEASECIPSDIALKYAPLLNAWRLDFLHEPFRAIKDFKFCSPTKAAASPNGKSITSQVEFDLAFTYLIEAMKGRTQKQLVFIYLPITPFLEKGDIVFVDNDKRRKDLFSELCHLAGVGFIDLTDDFSDFFRRTGRFPRGFFNSPPGQGHLNAEGQYLVAKKMLSYFAGSGLTEDRQQ